MTTMIREIQAPPPPPPPHENYLLLIIVFFAENLFFSKDKVLCQQTKHFSHQNENEYLFYLISL